MMIPEKILLEADAEEIRIDKYLAEWMPERSRSFLQKMIEQQSVLVNGKPVKVSYRLKEGDELFIDFPDPREAEIPPEDISLDILYEDNDLLIVNKPKGMVVHPAAGHLTGTLVNALMAHCKDQLSGINGVLRPGIVHRIDMNTTGSLIVCKNDAAHNSIAEQLKVHSITRKYLAIVSGVFKEAEGTVNAAIGRHPNDRKKMAVNVKNGKSAVTHYRVLEQFRNYALVECSLETGRTHQIRVHMASIHHPVLGDDVYGSGKCSFTHLQGQTLHAQVIGFLHPGTGEYVEFSAPLPQYFEDLLKILRNT